MQICWFSCRVDVLGRFDGCHVEWMFQVDMLDFHVEWMFQVDLLDFHVEWMF